MIKHIGVATVAIIAAGTPLAAHASGFLADVFVRPISPHLADEADKVHAELGNPLDHAGNAIAGTAVGVVTENPALGEAVTDGLEMRDAARRQGN